VKALSLVAALVCLLLPGQALAQTDAPKPYVIVVAPGHGGDDPGAVYPPNARQPQVEEKSFTLPIALKLRDRLQAEDVQVVMTRTTDVTTTAEQRAALAEKAHANVFVSVHVNSYYADPSVRGVEAQYFSDPALADDVADGLAQPLQAFNETIRTSKDREEDNILSMPGVIVEAGYMSNAADRQLLQDDAFQTAVAEGIYQGLLKYAPQIPQLKEQIEAAKAQQPKTATQPSGAPSPAHKGGVPGWLRPVGIVLAFGLAYVWLRNRGHSRRRPPRPRRPAAYGVVRTR